MTSERQTTTRRNVESATLLAQGKVNEVYSQGLVPEVQSGNGHTAATLPQHQAEHRDAGGVGAGGLHSFEIAVRGSPRVNACSPPQHTRARTDSSG